MAASTIRINRAPVLTLWAAVVAERLGYDHDESLSLAKALAGLNAAAPGKRLGIYTPSDEMPPAAKKAARAKGFLVECSSAARCQRLQPTAAFGPRAAASRSTRPASKRTWSGRSASTCRRCVRR